MSSSYVCPPICFYELVKNIAGQIRESQLHKNDQDKLIQKGLYPRSGLSQLRSHVDDGQTYFHALVTAKEKGLTLSPAENTFCLTYILCISYVYRNNAR